MAFLVNNAFFPEVVFLLKFDLHLFVDLQDVLENTTVTFIGHNVLLKLSKHAFATTSELISLFFFKYFSECFLQLL